MQLNEAHRALHRPSSLQRATRVSKLSRFSDVLKQKKNILRVPPYAAFCLTHKPTCKLATAVPEAPFHTSRGTFMVLFSPGGKASGVVEFPLKYTCARKIKSPHSYVFVIEGGNSAELVSGTVCL